MPRTYESLTHSLLNSFGDRKKPGRLSIFVDVEEERIYAVPRETEHIDYAKKLNVDYDKLIPVHIDTENYDGLERVVGVVTGVSGLEISGRVRHLASDLEKAHELAWDFIKKGEISVGEVEEDRINYKYAKK